MQPRKLFTLASCLTVVGLFASSCAPGAPPPPTAKPTAPAPSAVASPTSQAVSGTPAISATPKPAADQPRYGGILTRANAEDPSHLDVHQLSTISQLVPLASVYNGLVRFDTVELNKVVPDLAEKWDVSADGKTYTFYLRKGVKWHDGKPFSSADAMFSLERMAFWKEHKIVSPRGGGLLSAVDKVEAPDASTVKVTLKYASASFIDGTASGWVLMLPKHVIEARGDMKKDAMGTGAFKWKDWNFGTSNELVKNNDYFVEGLPYLDGIKIYVIKDEATRLAAFRTGQVRMTGIATKGLSHVQAEIVRKDMSDKAVAISHATAARYLLFMHSKRKPWNDVRVRQAVNLAFDRQAAIAINSNVGMLGAAMHPAGAWGIPQEEMAKRPGYRQPKDADIAEAKSLLAEAGYPNGFKTTMLGRGGGATEQVGVVAKDQLSRVGIEVTLDLKESADATSRLDRHDFDLSSFPLSDPLDDPDSILGAYYVTGSSRNYGEFSDSQVDDLFRKQAATLDEKERKKVVLEIQQRILDLAIYPVIFWDVYNIGFWREVRGYVPGFGATTQNNLDYVWLAR